MQVQRYGIAFFKMGTAIVDLEPSIVHHKGKQTRSFKSGKKSAHGCTHRRRGNPTPNPLTPRARLVPYPRVHVQRSFSAVVLSDAALGRVPRPNLPRANPPLQSARQKQQSFASAWPFANLSHSARYERQVAGARCEIPTVAPWSSERIVYEYRESTSPFLTMRPSCPISPPVQNTDEHTTNRPA